MLSCSEQTHVTVEMTPEEWAAIKDNPIQRDTERHAKKAMTKHLSSPSPSHAVVHAARLPDGAMFKLDGHTRAYLWEKGQLLPPKTVLVIVYEAVDVEEVKELYETHDNRATMDSVSDNAFGVLRDLGVKLTSPLLAPCKFASALRFLSPAGKVDLVQQIPLWLPELVRFDGLHLGQSSLKAPFLAAGLLTVSEYGDDVIGFWADVANQRGVREGDKSDAVDAIVRVALAKDAGNQKKRNEVMRKAVAAADTFMTKGFYAVGIKGINANTFRLRLEKVLKQKMKRPM